MSSKHDFGKKKKKHVQRNIHIIRLYMESVGERIVSWIRDGYWMDR